MDSLQTAWLLLLPLTLLPAQAPPVPTGPVPVPAGRSQPDGTLPEGAPPVMATIRARDLLAHATFLANPELGGRLTGSPGQEQAAKYIAEQFAALELEPLGDEVDGVRGYYQRYGVTRTFVADDSMLRIGEVEARTGYAVLGGKPAETRIEGKLRYCGFGRTRGAGAEVGEEDLAGTIPLVLVRPPRGKLGRELSVEEKFAVSFQSFGVLGRTTRNLEKKGARVVLFAMVEDPLGLRDVLNYLALAPGKDLLAPRFGGALDTGIGIVGTALGGGGEALALVLAPDLSAKVFAQLGMSRQVLTDYLAGDGEPPAAKGEVAASVDLTVRCDDEATACNVIACRRGRDPTLAAEAVVFSAHMDHVGRRIDGAVFTGADDNASGSAGLLGIAAAFARADQAPRRSVVFLSVSGEELGLWGSAWFADHPTWPAESIVANVNTDMIGRSGPESGPDEVLVTPSHDHRMFSSIVRDAANFGERMGVRFLSGDKYYQRSDHYNFAKKGVPVVFFCNGEHEDYHQVTDSVDKLEPQKMEKLARLAFWTGWSVANADSRPRTLGMQDDWK